MTPRAQISEPRCRSETLRFALSFVTLAASLAVAGPSAAAGFATARFGAEHGHVTTTNPTALYYNPAGIGFSSGTRLFADGSLAVRRFTWRHEPAPTDIADPGAAQGANSGLAELTNVFGAPMFGATSRFSDLALGASVQVPFGGRAHWSKNERFEDNMEFPLAADGVQRWHSIEGALTFIYFTVGVAYRIGPLSFGAAANLISSSVTSRKAKNPTGAGDPDTAHEGRVELDVGGLHGSFAAGALVEAIDNRLWIGASYQAQPGLGPITLRGTLDVTYRGGRTPFPVTLEQALPDIVRVGARFRPRRTLELRLFGDRTRWSVMQTQCVAIEGSPCLVDRSGADAGDGGTLLNLRRYWRDTYAARAGSSFWPNPALELFAGIGFETAATPDDTLDPELADSETLSGAIGARFEIVRRLFLATSYTHLHYLPRDNTGRSRLAQAELPTRRGDGGGRYTQFIGVLNANLEKEF